MDERDARLTELELRLDNTRDELLAMFLAVHQRLDVLERLSTLDRTASSLDELTQALSGPVEPDHEHNVASQLGRLADLLEPIAKRLERGW
jgi:uncharacterized protein Yka (UPF0111/DUF47 family)